MAQKIKLGARPKTFARTVTFPMPGEEMGSIEVKFRYRSRSEFAEFVDNLQAEAKAAGDEEISRLRSAIEAGSEVTNPTQIGRAHV